MPILLEEDYAYPLPKLHRVRQLFDEGAVGQVEEELLRELRKEEIQRSVWPGMKVAVAVGSRGIRNLKLMVQTLVRELKALGAEPFIVSAMGSHGGGTEEGQRKVLEDYGITEEELGVKVITTVDVRELGKTASGNTLWFDRAAMEADGIVPINRVKLHTDFVGELQSGLCKMLVIGLGNQKGCSAVHEEEPEGFAARIEEGAQLILEKLCVPFGVAVVENACDETCLIEAVPGERLIQREKEILKIAKTRMPFLIPQQIDVLIVEEIGKNISGAGYDPNILGKSSVLKEFSLPVPRIRKMVLLGVTPESHGNAIGLGMFDVTVEAVFRALDREAMYANAIACRCIEDCRVPLAAADEEEAIRVAIKCIRKTEPEELRIVRIKNTLELQEIQVSGAVLRDLEGNEMVRVESEEEG